MKKFILCFVAIIATCLFTEDAKANTPNDLESTTSTSSANIFATAYYNLTDDVFIFEHTFGSTVVELQFPFTNNTTIRGNYMYFEVRREMFLDAFSQVFEYTTNTYCDIPMAIMGSYGLLNYGVIRVSVPR